ncbi:hypothetical protein SEA_ASHERTHEMAN_80 [Gordonia phage Ashertheman]|uniref:Uncharacterized protein n=3 Tax=Kroosvirus TaxID=2948789 RepID=A0A385DW90_9CAUD|nr:hypothetical protein J1761_gp80 [Gordonia phage Kroos]YP_010001873.1 hypothetical protein J1764_gp80 [Gordonia phage Ashertheman]YP_010001959.1 hypothetical protein J1765_gp81 [Gordonia phage Gaea]AXQ62987.1 hypothetical protein SEA_ASHERTHEMAN_80 [Gordonia phage Ashertheman]AYR02889.1 hypothetical protein SEA_GAEA_81 [Gordonia phage Gaea]AYR03059.1 hypothetical protein SEA_KROOS_80 [Gordonia phage Kroos]
MSEIINYSGRLDELREGTVIRNGEGGTTCHFVKMDDGHWWPSDVAGKRMFRDPNGPSPAVASSRVFLPAVALDAVEITVQLATKHIAVTLTTEDVYDSQDPALLQLAELIARKLSAGKLLAN